MRGIKLQQDGKQSGHQEDSSTTSLLNLLQKLINMDDESIVEKVVAFVNKLDEVVTNFEDELNKNEKS